MAYSAGQLISMSVDSQGQAWGISYGTSPGWHQTIDVHRSITLRPERQESDWGLVGSLTVYRAGRSGTLERNTLEKSIEPRYPTSARPRTFQIWKRGWEKKRWLYYSARALNSQSTAAEGMLRSFLELRSRPHIVSRTTSAPLLGTGHDN